jgi:hypothetical protein
MPVFQTGEEGSIPFSRSPEERFEPSLYVEVLGHFIYWQYGVMVACRLLVS